MRAPRLPLAASKSASDPSAPPVATSSAFKGLTQTARMPFALVAWHGAVAPTSILPISSAEARVGEISRFLRALLSSLLLAVIASIASGGTPLLCFLPSPPGASPSTSMASADARLPGAAEGPAARAFARASRASSRSFMSLEMTRHAASCWYSACESSCLVP